MMTRFPRPGLRGSYRGSCVVCLRGTDTGFAVRGPAEAVIAALIVAGVPESEAYETARAMWNEQGLEVAEGNIPSGVQDAVITLCTDDADRAGLSVALLASGELPMRDLTDD
jgi:hypothetical protein